MTILSRRSIDLLVLLVLLLVALPIVASAQEGEIPTGGGAPPEGVVETIARPSDLVHIGIGPTVGIHYNIDDEFRGALRRQIPDADFGAATTLVGYGGSIRIDPIVEGFELGAYHLWGANSRTTTTSIGGVDHIRTARLETSETVGRLGYNVATAGTSRFYAGIGLGGGRYRLELVQAPRTGSGDPFTDTSFTESNPGYNDRRLHAGWLVVIPEVRWHLQFGSTRYLSLQMGVGLRALFDMGAWRTEEGGIYPGLPRNGSADLVATVTISAGLFGFP